MKAHYFFKSLLLLLITIPLTSFNSSKPKYYKNDTDNPVFSAKGLHYEKLLTNIFRGDFVDIPFDRDETTFVLLLNEYIDAYAVYCDASLPSNKVELMRPECVTERVTKDGYGWEISRTCIEWVDVGRGLYAKPKMREAQKIIERLQNGDAFRNLYKMMNQDNPIGTALTLVEKSKAIKLDMANLIKINGCKSEGLMRFEENLRLFALSKQPIRIDGNTSPETNITSNNQNFDKLIEDLVYEHSKKWAMNRYQRGSIYNTNISAKDSQNKPKEMTANYKFSGWNGQSVGSVRLTFTDGLPECLYFYDFPNACRTADRKIVSQFASGAYQK